METSPTGRLASLPELDPHTLRQRRERVLLILAGVFLGAMAVLNILGITKFVDLGKLVGLESASYLVIAVGVLPYPITFLCTDFISELYGRQTASRVVFVGLLVNLIVLGFTFIGARLPEIEAPAPFQAIYVAVESDGQTPSTLVAAPGDDSSLYRVANVTEPVTLRREGLFDRLATTTRMAMVASMIAYLIAQFVDVWMFHFWKRLTRGKHLWLRNNGSTLVSQLVDTTAVVVITFAGVKSGSELVQMVAAGYVFKLVVALIDTVPFYVGVRYLSEYLRVDPRTV